MTIEVITQPRKYRIHCGGCTAELEYSGAQVGNHPAGTRRWFKQTVRGVKCPICAQVIEHRPGPPPAPPMPPEWPPRPKR